jgi:HSP20 family protein
MVTITPLNTMLDRMVTLGRSFDQALATTDVTGNGSAAVSWVPALDAYETEHAYVVQIDLPGVSADQVDVSFERDTLTVRGTRARTVNGAEKEGTRVFFAERERGAFSRSLRFPQHVQGDKIDATFTNGVLSISIPKAESAKPRKIQISTATPARQIG